MLTRGLGFDRGAASVVVALALGLGGACGDNTQRPVLGVTSGSEFVEAMQEYAAYLPPALQMEVHASGTTRPLAEVQVAITRDAALCGECFALGLADGGYGVRAGGALGAQYGLSTLLEAMGVRFWHPAYTYVPPSLRTPDPAELADRIEAPAMAVRGVHLHILHPIEAYFALWEPGPDNVDDGRRVLDWLVKNRANTVAWPLLEDALMPARLAHQQALVAYAHLRGLRVGAGLQVFGESNLQRAYDLVEEGETPAEVIGGKLAPLTVVPYDSIGLGFGEFLASDPAALVAAMALIYDEVAAAWPGAEVTASVHVGNFEGMQVTYQGEDLLYYFLVKFAQRPIVPWVHTVMYYELFGDAGGAYNHQTFAEHRAFLLDRLAAGAPVTYFPENAYWVAFDNSLPQFDPVYIRNRFRDLQGIAEQSTAQGYPGLDAHVVFSSGWEWGYWQNDWAALRMSWRLPATYGALLRDMLLPLGEAGATAARLIEEVAEAQQRGLIEARLTPFIASDDATFVVGLALGVWSQPPRVAIAALATAPTADRAAFAAAVVAPLQAYAAELALLAARAEALASGSGQPVLAELADGVAIAATRAAFAHALWAAVVADDDAARDQALLDLEAQLAAAKTIIARRHQALWDPRPDRLVAKTLSTSLLYQYGYLREADELCFWERERAQARNALLGESNRVAACVL